MRSRRTPDRAGEGVESARPSRPGGPSQLLELFFATCAELGVESDRDVAALAGVSVENVANWRSGAVRELKPYKLAGVKRALAGRIAQLKDRASLMDSTVHLKLRPLEIEEGSSPAEQQRKLRDRVHYDYVGHQFLYAEAQGALAWESIIRSGYEQDSWLRGVRDQARLWFDSARDARGGCRGPIAEALGLDSRRLRGLDVISLGPGEGSKECVLIEALHALEGSIGQPLPWQTMALVDVSISLLVRAATSARKLVGEREDLPRTHVLAFCADFEEGPLGFVNRLPTERYDADAGRRLVCVLGNVFGNVRDEEHFLREKLARLVRPGDLLWLEVGLRADPLSSDPLYALLARTDRQETAAETNRRLLLEGPYRAWESALGRSHARVEMRLTLREDDDASRIPGSCNFCHDLWLVEERRALTMLYSRRYELAALTRWLEARGYQLLRQQSVADSKGRPRVAHLLLRRTSEPEKR
ncbi:L-histidine N(alpha)-methyltransferase [Sandaracinus amylolyticus]|nr:L-histidine N(alpha)-methyltransferase [Sandaracinus amylolyticus]